MQTTSSGLGKPLDVDGFFTKLEGVLELVLDLGWDFRGFVGFAFPELAVTQPSASGVLFSLTNVDEDVIFAGRACLLERVRSRLSFHKIHELGRL